MEQNCHVELSVGVSFLLYSAIRILIGRVEKFKDHLGIFLGQGFDLTEPFQGRLLDFLQAPEFPEQRFLLDFPNPRYFIQNRLQTLLSPELLMVGNGEPVGLIPDSLQVLQRG